MSTRSQGIIPKLINELLGIKSSRILSSKGSNSSSPSPIARCILSNSADSSGSVSTAICSICPVSGSCTSIRWFRLGRSSACNWGLKAVINPLSAANATWVAIASSSYKKGRIPSIGWMLPKFGSIAVAGNLPRSCPRSGVIASKVTKIQSWDKKADSISIDSSSFSAIARNRWSDSTER